MEVRSGPRYLERATQLVSLCHGFSQTMLLLKGFWANISHENLNSSPNKSTPQGNELSVISLSKILFLTLVSRILLFQINLSFNSSLNSREIQPKNKPVSENPLTLMSRSWALRLMGSLVGSSVWSAHKGQTNNPSILPLTIPKARSKALYEKNKRKSADRLYSAMNVVLSASRKTFIVLFLILD